VRELPTGTVTFLFTDIEGSTRLLHELGDAYADALAEHRRALRASFRAHGGVEVDTQGDAFFVAFQRASDAVAAAADAQRALADSPIRVRCGVHTGEPLITDEGYVGLDVHRAARIGAAGHGGQILVSQSTRDLAGRGLHDLGEHRLKDLTAPERIYQLGDGDFPPLKSLNRTNLPVAATPLVGREHELAELCGLLADGVRLVTVTGAGGSGKTRLALQVAAELLEHFGDGVFFVPLAPVQDAELVATTVAQAVGIRKLDELRDAETLLLLDNLEHLLAAASDLSSLLATAPRAKLLVTSRAPLRISGEREYALDPLPQDDAVEFFLERARAVKRDVLFGDAISEICRRVDGLPLALELAASRVKVLDPPLLLERLERRLPLLTGGARDAPERQQTLRATIEWSYDLLEAASQQAFRRLSVFAGSFSLEAAESVAGIGLEDVSALVDWSLLTPLGEGRFLMLETIREYAEELLGQTDESDAVRNRHLDYFLELVEVAEPNLTGGEQQRWHERLALEQDNVREALAYACDSADGERALMLAGTIWRFWWNRGQIAEAQRWYDRAFAVEGDASPTARARAVFGAAHMAEARGEAERARVQFGEAVDIFRLTDDTRWLVLALTHLAQAYHAEGDARRAESLNIEALNLALRSGDVRGAAITTSNMAYQLTMEGDDEGAAGLLEDALAGFRVAGDVYGIATSLANGAALALRHDDFEVAATNLRESLPLSSSIGDAHTLAHTLVVAAAATLARGDADASARLCAADGEVCRTHGFELEPAERQLLDETVPAARIALGDDFEEAWAAGAELELADAVELALRALD
jgi:predicted ATPase/class 3 adenylate cyclase/Tfp pilus assembly protein PilF